MSESVRVDCAVQYSTVQYTQQEKIAGDRRLYKVFTVIILRETQLLFLFLNSIEFSLSLPLSLFSLVLLLVVVELYRSSLLYYGIMSVVLTK